MRTCYGPFRAFVSADSRGCDLACEYAPKGQDMLARGNAPSVTGIALSAVLSLWQLDGDLQSRLRSLRSKNAAAAAV